MSYELFYSSVPKGLRLGKRGFCTVAATTGLPASIADTLESWSSYAPLSQGAADAPRISPPIYAHRRLAAGSKSYAVLSRISQSGVDYSGRPNHLAFHLVLEPAEQSPAGPAFASAQPGILATHWQGEPRHLPPAPAPHFDDPHPRYCEQWAAITGDPGWAGALAESFVLDPRRPVHLIYNPQLPILPLLVEATLLVPAHLRWQITYAMFLSDLPSQPQALWRCCAADTPAANTALKQTSPTLTLNLTAPLPKAPDGEFAALARTSPPMTQSTH